MIPADICRNALLQGGIIGLSQTIYAEDMFKAFDQLNSMLMQWNNSRFNLFNMIDLSVVSNGNESYTIGPVVNTQPDIVTPRPDKIMAAYVRMLPVLSNQPVDIPLQIVEAHEDYSEILLKHLTGFPVGCFWDSAFPVGNLYVWPIPTTGKFEIHVVLKNQLSQFTSLTDTINMPEDYIDGMTWNLALRLRPVYKLPPDQTIKDMALHAMANIKGANSQVAILKMPNGFGSGHRGQNSAWWYHSGGFS